MTKITKKLLIAGALTIAGTATLAGCSVVDSVLHKQSTESFDDGAQLRKGFERTPEWVPDDATEITLRTSTIDAASDAVILLQSTSALPEDACVEVPRSSAPSWGLEGAPDVYEIDTVYACGDWTVAAADGGWLGWTPNADAERTAATTGK